MTINEMAVKMYNAIDDKLGKDIKILNVGELSSLCDYFIIASAGSSRQLKAIAESVEDEMTKHEIEPRAKEGYGSTTPWILLDYGDIMVHIFDEENRDFYALERLWKDAPEVNIEDLENSINN